MDGDKHTAAALQSLFSASAGTDQDQDQPDFDCATLFSEAEEAAMAHRWYGFFVALYEEDKDRPVAEEETLSAVLRSLSSIGVLPQCPARALLPTIDESLPLILSRADLEDAKKVAAVHAQLADLRCFAAGCFYVTPRPTPDDEKANKKVWKKHFAAAHPSHHYKGKEAGAKAVSCIVPSCASAAVRFDSAARHVALKHKRRALKVLDVRANLGPRDLAYVCKRCVEPFYGLNEFEAHFPGCFGVVGQQKENVAMQASSGPARTDVKEKRRASRAAAGPLAPRPT
ncbi:hypothetical protein MKEN_00988800 [Mycena kentingensis (nom. inval.)]|nr:hypothetical protein MKEN_00988800 [Mycena kentingensis (nom. inval.)]